jgi:enhancing lycopene biosynthesis protein 2
MKSKLKQGVAHLDGSLCEERVVMMDSANLTAGLDDPSDVSDEEYDSVWVAGVVVASGQLVISSIS